MEFCQSEKVGTLFQLKRSCIGQVWFEIHSIQPAITFKSSCFTSWRQICSVVKEAFLPTIDPCSHIHFLLPQNTELRDEVIGEYI